MQTTPQRQQPRRNTGLRDHCRRMLQLTNPTTAIAASAKTAERSIAEGSLNWAGPDGLLCRHLACQDELGRRNNPSFEMDIYGGKHFDLDGTDLNVEAYYYSYPENSLPGPAASYYETIVQLSHTFGR